MSNRRSYGGGGGGGSGGYGGGGGRYNSGPSGGINPWQPGSSPGRGAPSLLNQNLLSQLASPDSQLSIAAKLLSSILPLQQGQPPSLMSLGGGYGGPRYGGGGGGSGGSGYGNERYRRDDRRGDQFRNRRPPNDRNRNDRKSGDKGRFEKPKKADEDKADAKEAASKEEKPKKMEEDKVKEKEKAEEESPDKADKAEDEAEKKESDGPLPGYENIPAKLFHCHVCGKSMWNDVSFDTHVKGRNHRNKLRDLEDGYLLQTDLMRQIAAISLKLEELRRGKRRPYPEQYCKMCDLHFNGMTMFAHRATDEHQSLKRFIHPSCDLCDLDFQVRLEYDEHILTPGHLQNEGKAMARREKFDKDPKYVALREQEASLRLLLEEVNNLGSTGSGPEISEEDRKLLETLGEDGQVPPYDPDAEQAVARHHVAPVEGFLCKVCKVFLLAPETVEVHCRTQRHYECYVNKLKAEANKRLKEKEAGDDKRKTDEKSEEEGSAKRRKTDSGEGGVNGDVKAEGDGAESMQVDIKDEVLKECVEAPEAENDGVEEEVEKEVKTPTKASPKTTARRGRGRGRK